MSQNIRNPKINSREKSGKKSFFVVFEGSEEVLYLKCENLKEAECEVKRFLHTDSLDETIEIFF